MKNLIIGIVLGIILGGCGKEIYRYGKDGTNGQNGTNGQDGLNGVSVVFSQAAATSCVNGGTTILMGYDTNYNHVFDVGDGNIQSTTICNGVNGTSAPSTPFTPVGLIDPCGDAPGRYDEVFLKLSNNTVLASFSDNASGLNTRFSVLTPGTYVTTDGDNCVFTINALGVITHENHHY